MKKSHLVLLMVTAILALSSAYSLAAINQVYNINFEWYSQLNGKYESRLRDISRDRCMLQIKQLNVGLSVIDDPYSFQMEKDKSQVLKKAISWGDMETCIYIYCSLGNVSSPEYRIKVVDIAQRGNNVEVKVSINTPESIENSETEADNRYLPEDVIKIKKAAFPAKGRLYVIFKNQDGKQLFDQYCNVR